MFVSIQVQVKETNTQYSGSYVGFGLVTQDPEAIARIPVDSTVLQSAITVYNDGIYANQERVSLQCILREIIIVLF